MATTEEQLVACINQSPANVAVHDRDGWLALFDDEAGEIEDPVGSPPVYKRDGTLGRFWDTFIAPHGIRFEVLRDCFLGHDVMRDALIHTTVGEGLTVRVEAYLLYRVLETPSGLRVRRMAAHWSLPRMTLIAMKLGPRGWLKTTALTFRMLGVMGGAWVWKYLVSPFRGVGGAGERALAALVRAVNGRDAKALDALGEPGAVAETRAASGPLGSLADAFGGEALAVDGPVCAGRTVTFRYTVGAQAARGGLGLLEFGDGDKLVSARFFGG